MKEVKKVLALIDKLTHESDGLIFQVILCDVSRSPEKSDMKLDFPHCSQLHSSFCGVQCLVTQLTAVYECLDAQYAKTQQLLLSFKINNVSMRAQCAVSTSCLVWRCSARPSQRHLIRLAHSATGLHVMCHCLTSDSV